MIIQNTSSPLKSLYIIGGRVLMVLKSSELGAMSPLALFEKYQERFERASFAYILYALDWLYITGCIELTKQGDISLCNY
ncbi:hypothetical protein F6476_33180 [Pseudomonas umsongensis]|uniref:ABC-three component system middle component 6 n=1 Tax=Pseudomonas umsongensis TaxID=198618 RepID=UPI0012453615|nr:ABC-three component system middle component 6 [Pseudomonas umsongensis]QFG33706.1 hypothetical protein F6476_33180 [Pseudomonas umsongensis]